MGKTVAKKTNNSWTVSTSRKTSGPAAKRCCPSIKIPKNSVVKQRMKETYAKKTTVTPKKFTTTEKWTRTSSMTTKPARKPASSSTKQLKPQKAGTSIKTMVTVNNYPQVTGFMYGSGSSSFF